MGGRRDEGGKGEEAKRTTWRRKKFGKEIVQGRRSLNEKLKQVVNGTRT